MRLISPDAIAVVTIFQEARGESQQGRIAVAEVIRNRTEAEYRSDGSVISTCLWPLQFSGWNPRDPNRIQSLKIDTNDPVVSDCMKAWEIAKVGSDLVKGADHYINLSIVARPPWVDDTKITAVIGAHTFLRLRATP